MMLFKKLLKLLILISLYFKIINCDIPLINYIEPLSQNDNIISIYGRFFGKKQEDVKVEIDLGKGFERYNISEWSASSLVLNLNPPLPRNAPLKLSVSQYTINHTISFMNPNCLGLTQCNGHGVCPGGLKCVCNEPWSGDDCSKVEGEDMLELKSGKQTVPLPNHLNNFQTSIGLVLKEITKKGYTVNSYLLTPAQEYGSINRADFLVNRYKTNTFMSSADLPFNCDITLNHYLANQTSSIGNNYIYQVKDGIGLAVIVRGFVSKPPTNKLILYLYPMIKSNNTSSNTSSLSSTPPHDISVSKIDNDDEIIASDPSTTITKNNYDTVNMIIDNQKLRSNIYDFGLILGNFSTFNTSVEKLYNISNIKEDAKETKLYSILSISAISSKYLYFFSDYYPTTIEDPPVNSTKPSPTPKASIQPPSNQHILDDDDQVSEKESPSPSPTPTASPPSKSSTDNIESNNATNQTNILSLSLIYFITICLIFISY
ncbi:hypothetical protein DICPUDRAFT_76185 [Dictyostelium purpureum]|uniref:EGF-like domain-containing protein n=1 Tax=Dictyostelium purpureum TaxID=5786 RepID=F0ZCV2_DICPU|nr:uncharacterized protein DICPUDRAFT_76185 [Dictyostelium purpureum]EGC38225.1 hypothetical protein DICPUDRAFT_76185 [Dictyostelium purpureum]|eukprot:XP_003285263.1 hypothetical protein DICPUDRAFT_76185 [Dictyostelium purpureum]